jgi:hypothetical protein
MMKNLLLQDGHHAEEPEPEPERVELTMVVRADCVPPRHRGGRLARFARARGTIVGCAGLSIGFAEGTYGESLDPDTDVGAGPPDLIVGFNAGLYAYSSWTHTLMYLPAAAMVIAYQLFECTFVPRILST